MFFETSSKTAVNVSKAFDEVAKQLFIKVSLGTGRASKLVLQDPSIELETPDKKNNCC